MRGWKRRPLVALLALGLTLSWAGCRDDVEPAPVRGPAPLGSDGDVSPADASADGSAIPDCGPGLEPCDGVCTDTSSNREHCSGCNMPCGPEQLCENGACVCDGGLEVCGDECVDTSSNRLHCGGCGVSCGPTEVCSGTCIEGDCPEGTTNCDGSCVDTSTSELHCSGCNDPCAEGESCVSSTCVCRDGFIRCAGRCLPEVTFSVDVEPIFTNTCASNRSCHAGARPASSLSLEPGEAIANLVGVPADQCQTQGRIRVVSGDPTQSYLMDKLLGRNMCSGNQMPLNGSTLSPTRLDAIRAWICGLSN